MTKTLSKPVWALLSLYALSELVLFMLVPELDQMNSFWNNDWNSNKSPLVVAYHLPSLTWLIMGGGYAALIYWLNVANFSPKAKQVIDSLLWVIWVILLVHAIDWLTMFADCKHANCNGGFLPT